MGEETCAHGLLEVESLIEGWDGGVGVYFSGEGMRDGIRDAARARENCFLTL